MIILLVCLIFGIAVMFLLIRNMEGKVRSDMNTGGSRKIRMIMKLILLAETAVFILAFLIVLVKTLFL
ncbi:MAG: hypothetical protein PUB75_00050 [Firmicutes bacterium]|nr:hypothetical protein [Bacillota bacterium]